MKLNIWVALIISLIIDGIDFTLGRIPLLGTVFDIITTIISVKLYGISGIINVWEVFDITDQIDGFVPTMTILWLINIFKKT